MAARGGQPKCVMGSMKGCLAVVSPEMGKHLNGHDNQDRTVHVWATCPAFLFFPKEAHRAEEEGAARCDMKEQECYKQTTPVVGISQAENSLESV